MKSKLNTGCFAVALVIGSGLVNPALGADGISRISGPSTGGPAYVSPDLGGGCTIGIEIEHTLQMPPLLMFFRKTPECDRQFPGKAQVATNISELLAAAVRDGQDLHQIKTVNPTAILQRDWVQNYIDCYAGVNDEADASNAAARLKGCDIASELSASFAVYGVAIRFESGEKAFGFDCEKLDDYAEYFDPAWLKKYQGRHCKLNVPTTWWFKASPL